MEIDKIIDNYNVLQSFKFNSCNYIIAEKNEGKDISYRLYHGDSDNAFGILQYSIAHESSDYLDIMREFTRGISVRIEFLDGERRYRGHPAHDDMPLLSADCIPGSMKENIEGKVIAIKAEALYPEYRTLSHQLYIATGGFGTSPTAEGRRAVYATNIYSGKKERFQRDSVLGVVLPERIPVWAQEEIAKMNPGKVADTPTSNIELKDPDSQANNLSNAKQPVTVPAVATKEQAPEYNSVIDKIKEDKKHRDTGRQKTEKDQRSDDARDGTQKRLRKSDPDL